MDADGLIDADGLSDALGLRDSDADADGLMDADGLSDSEPGSTVSSGASPITDVLAARADCTTSVSHITRETELLSVFAVRLFQPTWAAPSPLRSPTDAA
jgi:hypothetical protein